MARQLLFSEVAILIEAGASPNRDILKSQQVWQEYHAPPHLKRRKWFNTDFLIQLNNWDQQERPKATSVPIRPRTLGADFFVMLTPSGVATQLELLEGESIGKSSFCEEIRSVEKAVDSLWEVPRAVSVSKAPYLRVARLKKCIAFCVSSTTAIVELLNTNAIRVNSGGNLVGYRSAGRDILIDGVLYG